MILLEGGYFISQEKVNLLSHQKIHQESALRFSCRVLKLFLSLCPKQMDLGLLLLTESPTPGY